MTDPGLFTVRTGTKADLPAVLELIVELAIFEREPDAVKTTIESMERDGFGENSVFGFFVAESESKIVGISLYYYRYSTWRGKCLYLEDLIVTESSRGLGIGKALFEATIQKACDEQCVGMSWQVLDWNQPAIDFYQRYDSKIEKGWLNCSLNAEQLRQFAANRNPSNSDTVSEGCD